MASHVGLWIDHRKAILVYRDDDRERTVTLHSRAEPHTRLAGGSRSSTPWGPQDVKSESRADARQRQQLDRYYEEVIKRLGDADGIYVFGPGEAKAELHRALQRSKRMAARVLAVEPADKLTKPQVAAKVRAFFS